MADKLFQFGLGVLVFIALVFIGALPIMWLWNWLVPSLFGLATIKWVEAVGLGLLSKLLIGGFNYKSGD